MNSELYWFGALPAVLIAFLAMRLGGHPSRDCREVDMGDRSHEQI